MTVDVELGSLAGVMRVDGARLILPIEKRGKKLSIINIFDNFIGLIRIKVTKAKESR